MASLSEVEVGAETRRPWWHAGLLHKLVSKMDIWDRAFLSSEEPLVISTRSSNVRGTKGGNESA
jgi:lysozyme family protein